MKKILSFLIVCASFIIACSTPNGAQATASTGEKSETFKVAGACSMCKKRIEMAVYGVSGIKTAAWSAKEQALTVSYDSKKATNEAIQKRIAAAGHDTEKFKADEKSYKNLPDCCRYREVEVHEN
jgi:copper chaperone CopZ